MTAAVLTTALVLFIPQAPASQPKTQDCPMHDANSEMNKRGEQAMGFSQTATTHHFFLKPDGGVIQVEVKGAKDTHDRDNIRMHLRHIATMFADGNFNIPTFVHNAIPPGVLEMKHLGNRIQYAFEETPNGGRVVIATTDKTAIGAVHRFLRFQIQEHETGDPQQ
ncbi:MAG: hypothetical protein ACRD8A_02285 [Candidatus Acidiferrales bacterium]